MQQLTMPKITRKTPWIEIRLKTRLPSLICALGEVIIYHLIKWATPKFNPFQSYTYLQNLNMNLVQVVKKKVSNLLTKQVKDKSVNHFTDESLVIELQNVSTYRVFFFEKSNLLFSRSVLLPNNKQNTFHY